ncbi:hypothetical protein ACFLU4_02575 [Chloroflexota bacterium]
MKRLIIFFGLLLIVFTGTISCTTFNEEAYTLDNDTYLALAEQMDAAAENREYYAQYYESAMGELIELFYSLEKQQQDNILKLISDLKEGPASEERYAQYYESELKELEERASHSKQPQYEALIRVIIAYQEDAAKYRNMADQLRREAASH